MKLNRLLLILLLTAITGLLASCQPKTYGPNYDTCVDFEKAGVPVPIAVSHLSSRIDDGHHLRKIDNLIILVDDSLSMQECLQNSSKRKVALELATRINHTINGISIAKGIRVFGVNAEREDFKNVLGYGLSQHNNNNIRSSVITVIPYDTIFNPVSMALDSVYHELKGVSGNSAVIILSDFMNTDKNLMESVQLLKEYYGERVCLYPVFIGQPSESQAIVQGLAAVAGCGFMANSDQFSSPDTLTDYLESVLYNIAEKLPVLEPIAQLSYKKLLIDKELRITLRTQFELDKDIVLPEYNQNLQAIAEFMTEHQDVKTVIEGHTCNLGSIKYNLKLSLKRALAVKNYLVNTLGIAGNRLQVAAYGESRPVADNATEEGRVFNRRAVAVLTTIVQIEESVSTD